VQVVNRTIIVTALGPPPDIEPSSLRTELNAAGYGSDDLVIRLVVGGTRVCAANGVTCVAPTDASVTS